MTIGQPQNRIDGFSKVTGRARYAADFQVSNLSHAVIVGATIPAGAVVAIRSARAMEHAGVFAVLTHLTIGKVHKNLDAMSVPPLASRFVPMQGCDIRYEGQPVAIVIADTLEAAEHGATLVEIDYERHPFVTA